MRKIFVFTVLMMLSAFMTAQNTNKVAVMEVKAYDGVKQMHAVMIRGGLETAVGNTPGYEVYDRSNFEAIMQEQNFQRSGAVRDSDIKRLGELAGVQYIIVPEASAGDGQIYILVKMLDVETGKFGGVKEKLCEASSQEIKNACAELGKALFDTGTQGQKSKTDVATTSDKTTTTQKKTTPVMTSGPVKNEFSVSETKKVEFSKGNLQYQASTGTWRFAEHPWDYIGQDNEKIGKRYSGWIDLFGWGTSGYNEKYPYMTSKTATDYGDGKKDITSTNYDWGVYNKISNGGDKKWRTLTKDEWDYVFNKRTTRTGIRYAKAVVNGVNGMILLPDNWDDGIFELFYTNKHDAEFNDNIISQTEWKEKFETNGAVFLPAAGSRYGNKDLLPKQYRPESIISSSVGTVGRYWSTTSSDFDLKMPWATAYSVGFGGSYFTKLRTDASDGRYDGNSVRLVTDVK